MSYTAIDNLLLPIGHFFQRNFNPQITTGNHNSIRTINYFINIFQSFFCFDLTDYFGVYPYVYPLEKEGEVSIVSIHKIVKYLKEKEGLKEGWLVVLHGDYFGKEGGVSTVRVVKV